MRNKKRTDSDWPVGLQLAPAAFPRVRIKSFAEPKFGRLEEDQIRETARERERERECRPCSIIESPRVSEEIGQKKRPNQSTTKKKKRKKRNPVIHRPMTMGDIISSAAVFFDFFFFFFFCWYYSLFSDCDWRP